MKSTIRTRTKTQALNGVCEAQKCFAEATVMVKVSAGIMNGRQIAIPLSLCNNCVKKFDIIQEQDGQGPRQGPSHQNGLTTLDTPATPTHPSFRNQR